ncbi:hypothetical protein, partial [Nocardiopsis protaetiae]|uniref:hypothetical protein n=1 Tax=Nocardiopsis protaetiae TaxID=3382270 RepID=UPI00387AE2B5
MPGDIVSTGTVPGNGTRPDAARPQAEGAAPAAGERSPADRDRPTTDDRPEGAATAAPSAAST